jgi:GNAT superfamily N-acetyltransferase
MSAAAYLRMFSKPPKFGACHLFLDGGPLFRAGRKGYPAPMIHLRAMTVADVPLGMQLKAQAGWNQTEADWLRLLDMQPDGCFVIELDGRPVGTVATCEFGSVAWIAMVLVEASVRGQGLGKRLMRHALDHLDGRGLPTARLDATELGRPIYQRLGFRAEFEVVRWEAIVAAGGHADLDPRVEPAARDQLDAAVELDCRASGNDRRRLLERLWHESPESTWVVRDRDGLAGYLCARPGTQATQIGPGAATGPEAGRALAETVLRFCAGRSAYLDVPAPNDAATDWARSRGFVPRRHFTRMTRGEPVSGDARVIWASFGPELG